MTKIVPTGDNIVVQPIDEETASVSGIIIPETATKERTIKGKVLAVGPGKMLDNGERALMDVVEGDVVLFYTYGPKEVKHEGEDVLVISNSDVYATLV